MMSSPFSSASHTLERSSERALVPGGGRASPSSSPSTRNFKNSESSGSLTPCTSKCSALSLPDDPGRFPCVCPALSAPAEPSPPLDPARVMAPPRRVPLARAPGGAGWRVRFQTTETRLRKSRGRLDATLPPRVACGRVGGAQTSFSVRHTVVEPVKNPSWPRVLGKIVCPPSPSLRSPDAFARPLALASGSGRVLGTKVERCDAHAAIRRSAARTLCPATSLETTEIGEAAFPGAKGREPESPFFKPSF